MKNKSTFILFTVLALGVIFFALFIFAENIFAQTQQTCITRTLKLGSYHSNVRTLQKILNTDPATRVAAQGAGSPGKETLYFGPATHKAVVKFQNKYAAEILVKASGTTRATGFVGSYTIRKLNTFCSLISSGASAPAPISVKPPVQATQNIPQFKHLDIQQIDVGNTISFEVLASSTRKTPITYSAASQLPKGVIFNPLSHTFTWTPTSDQTGNHTFYFTASDGTASNTQTVFVSVIDRRLPPLPQPQTSQIVSPTSIPPVTHIPTSPSSFILIDNLLYANKPNMASLGFNTRFWTDGDGYWKGTYPNFDTSIPDENATRKFAVAMSQKYDTLIVDIEHWPTDIRKASRAEVDQSIANLTKVLRWLKSERPQLKIGLYGVLPIRDYWVPRQYIYALTVTQSDPAYAWYKGNLEKFRNDYNAWREANQYLMPLAAEVDFIFPSIYTFYDDEGGWQIYARENINEARRYGKPIYPFITPNYQSPTVSGSLPRDTWRRELEFIKGEGAPGVVVWGGWQESWNNNAPWWLGTKDFMTANGISFENNASQLANILSSLSAITRDTLFTYYGIVFIALLIVALVGAFRHPKQ